jgi:hypothetical protein
VSEGVASYNELQDQLRFIEGSHNWLYGEKQRLEGALRAIVAAGPDSTVEELVSIAVRHLPRTATQEASHTDD